MRDPAAGEVDLAVADQVDTHGIRAPRAGRPVPARLNVRGTDFSIVVAQIGPDWHLASCVRYLTFVNGRKESTRRGCEYGLRP